MSSHPPGYLEDKEAILKRLARIEGQVRGTARMVEDDRYCIDVLTTTCATASSGARVTRRQGGSTS